MPGNHADATAAPTAAAIYARSADPAKQDEQVAACLTYVRSHALHVAQDDLFIEDEDQRDEWYARPALAQMQQAMIRDRFRVLLVSSREVLFRSDADFDGFSRVLGAFGVRLVIVAEA